MQAKVCWGMHAVESTPYRKASYFPMYSAALPGCTTTKVHWRKLAAWLPMAIT